MDKPLLMVDVDGVISLFGFDSTRPPAGHFQLVDGIAHLLSATAGDHLCTLAHEFELVWCSGWEEKANVYLPLALGLPGALPHVPFDELNRPPSARWKLVGIDTYAGPSRPLAWVDDAHDDRCVQWAAGRVAPTLLISTEPAVGLTEAHVAELLAWAADLNRGRRTSRGDPPRP